VSERYRPLSAAEVADVLPSLPGWTGDTRRLVLSVVVPDVDALLHEVAAVESELDHHASAEQSGAAVTFTVWSHSCDAVTAADVELARRISELVADAPR
jgi:pterin-4a-carbinolamine dehydratase